MRWGADPPGPRTGAGHHVAAGPRPDRGRPPGGRDRRGLARTPAADRPRRRAARGAGGPGRRGGRGAHGGRRRRTAGLAGRHRVPAGTDPGRGHRRVAGPAGRADARTDPRVAGLPPVQAAEVVSYLGVPLFAPDRAHVVGVLAVFGPEPRRWTRGTSSCSRSPPPRRPAKSSSPPSPRSSRPAGCARARHRRRRGRQLRLGPGHRPAELGRPAAGAFGYDPRRVLRRHRGVPARLHPDDPSGCTRRCRRRSSTGGVFEAEFRVVLPGETRWVPGRGRALPDDRGHRRPAAGRRLRHHGAAGGRCPGRPGAGGDEGGLLLPRPRVAVHLCQRRGRAGAGLSRDDALGG